MPPRPRPRPNPVFMGSPPAPVVGQSEASTSSAARKIAKEEEEDEDDLFIRSKGRSLKEVHKRVARAAAMAESISPTGSEDENEDEEDTPKQEFKKNRKQNVFGTGKAKALPKWTKKGVIKNLFIDSDSESENNQPTYDGHTLLRKRRGGSLSAETPKGKHGKRVRTRSRSRSLTPPPDLTLLERMRAQKAIQHALDSNLSHIPLRSSVVEVEDDGDEFDTGETMLDPALQYIAKAVRDRASRHKMDDGLGRMHHSQQAQSGHHSTVGSAVVCIRVKWVAHPEDDVMHGRPQQSWLFTVKRHDSLKELFLQTSDKAHVLAEDLVLMRGGKQVFTSVSPEGLGFWDQGDLEACDRVTFNALRLCHLRSPTPAQQSGNDSEPDREVSAGLDGSQQPDDTSKFKVVLRAQGMKEITLSVRSTTTCGKIMRAYLAVMAKQAGKALASPRKAARIHLSVDGEKQHPDTPISACDLEDGDMIDVIGM